MPAADRMLPVVLQGHAYIANLSMTGCGLPENANLLGGNLDYLELHYNAALHTMRVLSATTKDPSEVEADGKKGKKRKKDDFRDGHRTDKK